MPMASPSANADAMNCNQCNCMSYLWLLEAANGVGASNALLAVCKLIASGSNSRHEMPDVCMAEQGKSAFAEMTAAQA